MPPAHVENAVSGLSHGNCLVTGGGGFLGRAIVERLIAARARVSILARQNYPELRAMGAVQWRADLRDATAVAEAVAGCDTVFHVAARAGVWGSYRDFFEPNVIGTRNVLRACREGGVARLVYTSSPSVVFDGRDMCGVDESSPYPLRHHSHYSATKAVAEQEVLAASGPSLRTIALRPHLVWGPRDNHIVPRLIARARAGKLRRVGDGKNRVDTTYIDNAADAHILAAAALDTNPRAAGRAYFISNGEPRPLWDIVNAILATAGLPPVTRGISRGMACLLGGLMEVAYGVVRSTREPPMTRFVANELATSHWFDLSAARRELGYEPHVSIDEGLKRLTLWFGTRSASERAEQRAQ
ncbi:3 beta-hydroxysteroid dehydrogenase/Delta 5--_4-isomerase [Phycisphaerae bacterium RAS1]|nr:3 beta-hydroxysteroid dehydrogenase/Delta 5-->4-isomerase [Phycisphaerae bacterium RAS1]